MIKILIKKFQIEGVLYVDDFKQHEPNEISKDKTKKD